jgi:hypothetical protein
VELELRVASGTEGSVQERTDFNAKMTPAWNTMPLT